MGEAVQLPRRGLALPGWLEAGGEAAASAGHSGGL